MTHVALMLNASLVEIVQNVDASVVIVEIHLIVVMLLVVRATMIAQPIRNVAMVNVLIRASITILVHHVLNVVHKITWRFVGVHLDSLEIHTLIVGQNRNQNVSMTLTALQDWLAFKTNAPIHVRHFNHANYHPGVRSSHHHQYEL